MNIRPANPEEVKDIIKLNTVIFRDLNLQFDPDYDQKFFANETQGQKYFDEALNKKDGHFLVAEENGELIGYANGGFKEITYRHGKYFEIDNVGVLSQWQGKGVGKQLLEAIIAWAKQQGYTKVYLQSYYKNDKAVQFYKTRGFEPIDISLEKTIES
jgi:GNAT superfamily N-acetyltransferase